MLTLYIIYYCCSCPLPIWEPLAANARDSAWDTVPAKYELQLFRALLQEQRMSLKQGGFVCTCMILIVCWKTTWKQAHALGDFAKYQCRQFEVGTHEPCSPRLGVEQLIPCRNPSIPSCITITWPPQIKATHKGLWERVPGIRAHGRSHHISEALWHRTRTTQPQMKKTHSGNLAWRVAGKKLRNLEWEYIQII